MALPKAHHIETLSEFNSLKFSYDSTNTHYFTGGTDTIVEGTPDILYTDIAYIKPLSAIYTHAKIYPCPVLEYDVTPTASSENLMTSGNIKNALDNNQRVFYAVTETAGATAVKEFTIPNFPTETINGVKTPLKGTIITVTSTNTDATRTDPLQFKINDGGEFPLYYNGTQWTSLSYRYKVFGSTTRRYTYVFDGASWNWLSDGHDADTTYSAGTGLKLSNGQFSLNVPNVTKSANSLPGVNSAMIENYTSGENYNLPTNNYYNIITIQGSQSTYATQLAMASNSTAVFYRSYIAGVWQDWLRLDNPTMDSTPTAGNTSNVVSSAGIKTYVDTQVATKSNVVIRQWVTQ